MKSCKSHEKKMKQRTQDPYFSVFHLFWCFLWVFFMWYARFKILICEPQSIWRKLFVLSWLYNTVFSTKFNGTDFIARVLQYCNNTIVLLFLWLTKPTATIQCGWNIFSLSLFSFGFNLGGSVHGFTDIHFIGAPFL